MGTLGKSDNNKMSFRFDGTAKSFPAFKEAMIKWAEKEFPWMIRGGNVICAIYQAANAKGGTHRLPLGSKRGAVCTPPPPAPRRKTHSKHEVSTWDRESLFREHTVPAEIDRNTEYQC